MLNAKVKVGLELSPFDKVKKKFNMWLVRDLSLNGHV